MFWPADAYRAAVGAIVRSYFLLAELESRPVLVSHLRRKYHSTLVASAVPSRIKYAGREHSGNHQGQKQLWEDLFTNPSQWWDNRLRKKLDNKSVRHPDFRHTTTGELLWLNNQSKPTWVKFRLATLDAQRQSGLVGSSTSMREEDDCLRFCEEGNLDRALELLWRTDQQSVPSVHLYGSLLDACARRRDLAKAQLVHCHLAKTGLESTRYLGESLVKTLVACGGLEDAVQVFHNLPHRTGGSWTALISGYATAGRGREALRLFRCMQEEGLEPDKYTFISLLRACGDLSDLEEGKRLHAETSKHNHQSELFIGTCLIDMYAKCGSISDALSVFDGLPQRDLVAWNVMLSAYAQQGQGELALQLYERIQEERLSPDARTLVCALQACCITADKEDSVLVSGRSVKVKALAKGKVIHADTRRKSYDSDGFVGSILVSLYGKCGSVEDAQIVFEGLSHQDVVSRTALLGAYAEQNQPERALELYLQMHEEGVSPDLGTFVSVVQACGMLAEKEQGDADPCEAVKAKCLQTGKALHADIIKKGYYNDRFVRSSLVSMYGKCGSIADAQDVFDGYYQRDVVTWNALLAAYIQQGNAQKVLQLCRQMQEERVSPNEITFVCILQTCSNTGGLDLCRQIHHDLISITGSLSSLLTTTLIHSYGRCSSMVDAQNLFDTLPQPSLVSWNALIASYTRQGNCMATLLCYEKMRRAGMKPDSVTFLSLLSACSHAGLVDKGVWYFESMSRDHGLTPEVEHYASMVDLLGRAGYFSSVEKLLASMPVQPDLAMWLCLLGACRMHRKVVLGKRAFDCAVHLQPKHCAAYVMMLNIYADAGLWESAKEMEQSRLRAGASKSHGQSWIKHELDVHIFAVGNSTHAQQQELCYLLGDLGLQLEARGRLSLQLT